MAAKRVLDPGVEPTYVRSANEAAVRRALDMLQIKGYDGALKEDVIGAIVVAVAKHLERNGSTSV